MEEKQEVKAEEKEQKLFKRKIDILIKSVDRIYPKMHNLIWRSFVHGLFFGLGTTIGLSIVLAIVAFILNQLKLIPGISNFINQANIEEVMPENSGFRRY